MAGVIVYESANISLANPYDESVGGYYINDVIVINVENNLHMSMFEWFLFEDGINLGSITFTEDINGLRFNYIPTTIGNHEVYIARENIEMGDGYVNSNILTITVKKNSKAFDVATAIIQKIKDLINKHDTSNDSHSILFQSKADTNHNHGVITNNGTGLNSSGAVYTHNNADGLVLTDKSTGKLKVLSGTTERIVNSEALGSIGSSAWETQKQINKKINTRINELQGQKSPVRLIKVLNLKDGDEECYHNPNTEKYLTPYLVTYEGDDRKGNPYYLIPSDWDYVVFSNQSQRDDVYYTQLPLTSDRDVYDISTEGIDIPEAIEQSMWGGIPRYCIIVKKDNFDFLTQDIIIPFKNISDGISFINYSINGDGMFFEPNGTSSDSLSYRELKYLPNGIYKIQTNYSDNLINLMIERRRVPVNHEYPIRWIITDNIEENGDYIYVEDIH